MIENTSPDSENIKDNRFSSEDESNFDENVNNVFPSELNPTNRIRSFGISFVVDSSNPKLDICLTWARYFHSLNEDGEEIWTRKPFYKIFSNLDLNKCTEKIIEDSDGEKPLKLFIKKRNLNNNQINVMLSLVNILDDTGEFLDCSTMIFQPSIRINYNGKLPNLSKTSFDDSLEFIHRNRKIKARGHMCSAIWEDIDYMNQFDENILWPDGLFFNDKDDSIKKFKTPTIRTEFVPMYSMPLLSFDIWDNKLLDKNLSEKYNDNLLKAKNLSEIWETEDIDKELNPLIQEYEKWIKNQELEEKSLNKNYIEITSDLISKQKIALERMKEGLNILKTNSNARLAFCFANKSILTQYSWKKDDDEFKWRGFQIAFFLMNIESLINKNSKNRDVLDLLWISTGGGKTEAYLAIMAFIMVYRRLTNENYAGTSIISRYTLRLLTVQQFLRTLSLITATEYLRVLKADNEKIGWRPKKCDIDTDWIYGSLRFSLGMWVGSTVTPNKLLYEKSDDSFSALNILKSSTPENSKSKPAQVLRCPVCGNWLSIPENGLSKEDSLFIVIKIENDSITGVCDDLKDKLNFIENIKYYNQNHENGYFTLELKFNTDIKSEALNQILECFNDDIQLASLSIFNPGYFAINTIKARKHYRVSDFEIYCTDPNCKLNSDIIWKEGHPLKEGAENKKLDKYYERFVKTPFKHASRIPIPAYTVDDQIYSKCPTVIIGTADKIARIAYENRVSTIFGNVSSYNKYYGFLRNKYSLPNHTLQKNLKEEFTCSVDKFLPPDLIIQDELHLIDGPLGSLFGLYETILSLIIKENGGNPKYIASSATIKNAELQSKLLFAKKLYQFPPHGLDINDNFFVKEQDLKDVWNENIKGRVYMGIYSPGRGPITPQVRLWSNILNNSLNHENQENIKYYWTIVGYYNAIRELGGGLALFREDISERFEYLSGTELDSDKRLELSSRLNSTKVPLELSKIEMDGDINTNQHPDYKAIFTTSMFGTGVDISHLSLMIINGQPKTTESYIQASGRIGREHGGLVVNFLRAGRPRDLSHYEMFPAYHHKIQTNVEPVSVSPFSKGALDKAIGPNIVSFLRNSTNMKFNWDAEPILPLDEDAESDFEILKNNLNKRLKFIFDEDEDKINEILSKYEDAFNDWVNASKEDIDFYYSDNPEDRCNVVLGSVAHEHNSNLKAIYKKALNSLREVEETTAFWV